MKKVLMTAALTLAMSAPAMAGTSSGNYVRVGTGFDTYSFALEDDFGNEYSEYQTAVPFTLEVQTESGLFGGVGYTQATIEEFELNNETVDVNEDYDVVSFGLGYRAPWKTHGEGRYIGIGYTRHEVDDFDSTTDIFSLFSEKDNDKRYGRIAISYEQDESLDMFTLSGKHIWFVARALGIGVNWSLGAGEADLGSNEEADAGSAALGFSIMLRGDL